MNQTRREIVITWLTEASVLLAVFPVLDVVLHPVDYSVWVVTGGLTLSTICLAGALYLGKEDR